MNMFRILTPITYWILIAIWSYILFFLLRRLSFKRVESNLINMLIIILAIDAFRTVVESIYFGAWYTSLSGLLPIGIHNFLIRSEIVIIPKLLNVMAAVLIIAILFRKWFPAEKNDREILKKTIEEHTKMLEDSNKQLKIEITERKQAETSLRKSETLLKKIAENFPNSYLSIIEKDYTIGFTSGNEFKKLDLNPKDFEGLSVKQVFGENTSFVIENFQKTFAGEEQSFELFINDQYQQYNTVPIISDDGSIDRILSVSENITARKNNENEIENTLRSSEKQRIANLVILKDLNESTSKLRKEISDRMKAEETLKARMIELEIFNDGAVDRELMINNHRKEINKLLEQLGKKAKYDIVG